MVRIVSGAVGYKLKCNWSVGKLSRNFRWCHLFYVIFLVIITIL